MHHIGFTGTLRGMSDLQKNGLRLVLRAAITKHGFITLHHGDCVGSDEGADRIAREEGAAIVIHPPFKGILRAYCNDNGPTAVRDAAGYLERNRHIVDETALLVAAPQTTKEELRSGTWSTVRYARTKSGNIIVLQR